MIWEDIPAFFNSEIHIFLKYPKGGSSLIGDFSKFMFLFSNALPKNESENRNNNKRIIHDNNEDIDIKIDTDIDMITVHTADHQLSINLLGKSSLSLYLVLIPPWLLWQWSAASQLTTTTNTDISLINTISVAYHRVCAIYTYTPYSHSSNVIVYAYI